MNNVTVKSLAGFFENPAAAEALIMKHLERGLILNKERERITNLHRFYTDHLDAYRKRQKHGTPHKMEILERSLDVKFRGVTSGGQRQKSGGFK